MDIQKEIQLVFILRLDKMIEDSPKSGGSQLTLASVCESRKSRTSPVACLAPASRAVINPERSGSLTIFTFGKYNSTYLSNFCLRNSVRLRIQLLQGFDGN